MKADGSRWKKLRNRAEYVAGDGRKTARIIALVTGADRRAREAVGG